MLMDCATIHGAAHLGLNTGEIAAGQWADFALLDLRAPSLAAVNDENLMAAMVFGGSAESLVADTCMAGRWMKRAACD